MALDDHNIKGKGRISERGRERKRSMNTPILNVPNDVTGHG